MDIQRCVFPKLFFIFINSKKHERAKPLRCARHPARRRWFRSLGLIWAPASSRAACGIWFEWASLFYNLQDRMKTSTFGNTEASSISLLISVFLISLCDCDCNKTFRTDATTHRQLEEKKTYCQNTRTLTRSHFQFWIKSVMTGDLKCFIRRQLDF